MVGHVPRARSRGTGVLGTGRVRRRPGASSAGRRAGVRAGHVPGRTDRAGRIRGRECVVPMPSGRHAGGHGRMAIRRRARVPAQRVRADHRGRKHDGRTVRIQRQSGRRGHLLMRGGEPSWPIRGQLHHHRAAQTTVTGSRSRGRSFRTVAVVVGRGRR